MMSSKRIYCHHNLKIHSYFIIIPQKMSLLSTNFHPQSSKAIQTWKKISIEKLKKFSITQLSTANIRFIFLLSYEHAQIFFYASDRTESIWNFYILSSYFALNYARIFLKGFLFYFVVSLCEVCMILGELEI